MSDWDFLWGCRGSAPKVESRLGEWLGFCEFDRGRWMWLGVMKFDMEAGDEESEKR